MPAPDVLNVFVIDEPQRKSVPLPVSRLVPVTGETPGANAPRRMGALLRTTLIVTSLIVFEGRSNAKMSVQTLSVAPHLRADWNAKADVLSPTISSDPASGTAPQPVASAPSTGADTQMPR